MHGTDLDEVAKNCLLYDPNPLLFLYAVVLGPKASSESSRTKNQERGEGVTSSAIWNA